MKRTALVVEDEQPTLQRFAAVLRKSGWAVVTAANGEDALTVLRSRRRFDVMFLDLRLPDMGGFDMLDRARGEKLTIPPVFVVTAYLDEAASRHFVRQKARILLPKPLEPRLLPDLAEALRGSNEAALINLTGMSGAINVLQLHTVDHGDVRSYIYEQRDDPSMVSHMRGVGTVSKTESLSDKIQRREDALVRHFRNCAHKPASIKAPEPLLVVARRWNSWYPSYFSVLGGAYAVLGAQAGDGATQAALIDPGFRALEVLDRIGIPVGCLKRCVITHNHPDHIGGVFEYVAARHAAGESTQVFCSPAVNKMLRGLAGTTLSVTEFLKDPVELVSAYTDLAKNQRSITATPLRTFHQNIGDTQRTRGVILTSEVNHRDGHTLSRSSCVLLGDTEYHSDGPRFRKIRKALAGPGVKVAVLHIGSSQLKARTGGHLYLPGLRDILKDVDNVRRKRVGTHEDRLLVLISEWGLEHATAAQIAGALSGHAAKDVQREFGSKSPILETIEVMKSMCPLDTITLLPADAGLVVGIESGKVYLDGVPVNPKDVVTRCSKFGLSYHSK